MCSTRQPSSNSCSARNWVAPSLRACPTPPLILSAPHLLDVEVAQALRRYARDRLLTPREAAAALDNLRALDIERHGHEALLDRVWALRDNLTAYDAVYVALAEALGTTLITCDRKLARSPGMASRIALVS